MAIYALGDLKPKIHTSAFVHPDATVIGDVTIGEYASIWPQAVLRGDYGHIEIGSETSIQDGTVIHATAELATLVGSRCVVGHIVHLEGCRIESDVLIGSGSIVLHEVLCESHSLVGANAVVTNGTLVPSYSMALGVPAKIFQNKVTEGQFKEAVQLYVENAARYKRELRRIE
ncbi:Carbonic anhydrase or acetyltransferase, isoleucine patch superfamily [Ferrithrix thermotolerans DSM 19514]|uniref:Carbonic anhydrase or acetyltransferase, isoleucine patch superfamily n=1 Tax=Ferrithrix thermotolerans DSM 19514 TaxID=1121881 RepID=A0A1M4W195_9ACTN|nr:gamma carbonic anhydrase family protein [Ferrithrix thermotolerans]SHE74910.1 Carbonic anhydrase or acetyltransferase, isoleucine patch superfamily [Ferrithrix thermotolerans DSM 19514]